MPVMALDPNIQKIFDLLCSEESEQIQKRSSTFSNVSRELTATTNILESALTITQKHCDKWSTVSNEVLQEKLNLPVISLGKDNAPALVSVKKQCDKILNSNIKGCKPNIVENILINCHTIDDNLHKINNFIRNTNKTISNYRLLIDNMRKLGLQKTTSLECLSEGGLELSSFCDHNVDFATSSPIRRASKEKRNP
ncbi:uncharacterized protein [Euwallacea fornicatus]|uniref:uncharacterized protein n=1 Tax=Euwallacea fornicatus TaxID=995702 RepID=UPI00338F1B1E